MPEQTKELITQEPLLSPSEVVENATTQAKLLIDIVEKTKCYQKIADKKYLQVEAWETIGAFNRVHAETKKTTPITQDKDGTTEVTGYNAHVQLLKDNIVVGGAIMPCYLTENCCKGKHGADKHRACMSAAQTFAESKAFRMNYSYVAILAGYQPMPAEEITKDMSKGNGGKEKITRSSGEHEELFEDSAIAKPIDWPWLRSSLDKLKWGWRDVATWLTDHYTEAAGNTAKQVIESLTQEHQEQFVAEVKKRLAEQGE